MAIVANSAKADISKTTTMNVEIRFDDCDPAGIVFFPRHHRCMDASSLHFFVSCGVPPWHELICESLGTRIFCARVPQDRRCIHGIPVPEDILPLVLQRDRVGEEVGQ